MEENKMQESNMEENKDLQAINEEDLKKISGGWHPLSKATCPNCGELSTFDIRGMGGMGNLARCSSCDQYCSAHRLEWVD